MTERAALPMAPVDFYESPAHVGAEYEALVAGCGLVLLGARTRIELRGADRAAFLHNLTTNDIRALPVGRGCEAFLLNAQGKILYFVTVFAGDDAHTLDTVPGCNERLLAHLDRYLIREQVELRDQTPERTALLLAGPKAGESLQAAGVDPPTPWLAHGTCELGGAPIELRRTDWTGPVEWLISTSNDRTTDVWNALVAHGAAPVGRLAFEQARVERGAPWPGVDVTEANLPQEVGRDARTISFTKGCYIGQETVARIDALGHVNRLLVGLKFPAGSHPDAAAGESLSAEGKPIGRLTSVVDSPRLQAPLALGYLRASHVTPGTRVDSPWGPAEVVKLPLESGFSTRP